MIIDNSIYELARKAGFEEWDAITHAPELEVFAALVIEKYRSEQEEDE